MNKIDRCELDADFVRYIFQEIRDEIDTLKIF